MDFKVSENLSRLPGQRVVTNGAMSHWWLVATDMLQGSIWGPVLLNVFINGLDDRDRVHSQQIHKLFQTGGSVNTLEARTAIQRDLVWKDGLTETS